MMTHRWIAAALCASALLLSRHAAANDEILVRAKPADAFRVDPEAVRVDLERARRTLAASLDRALAAAPRPASAPPERVASASADNRETLLK